ncbi:hypothetical protein BTA51_08270 [Hahella sp. CCB-MM4]|uniref:CesT family type III secretion system chaperone n=1 Tax=Hahella sp. (strain CCB-MM4) TaxID=1926491 RepID=UPI000B9BF1CB|nr:CesT family type III secretion system chaperone [Hahella sp. CCB-MM4]OZG73794.1 hypothetical protein BTA51_08270 [Hahella sp. CCB-MM4]
MEPKQRINTLLKEFSQLNGLPEFQLNDENVCGFQYIEDNLITLFLTDDQNQLVLLGELAPIDDAINSILVRLLEYSFPGLRTKGAAINVNPDENTLVLSFVRDVEGLTAQLFSNILKNFIETILHLKTVIKDYLQEASPTPSIHDHRETPFSSNELQMIRG